MLSDDFFFSFSIMENEITHPCILVGTIQVLKSMRQVSIQDKQQISNEVSRIINSYDSRFPSSYNTEMFEDVDVYHTEALIKITDRYIEIHTSTGLVRIV